MAFNSLLSMPCNHPYEDTAPPLSDASAAYAPTLLDQVQGMAGPSRPSSTRSRFDSLSQACAIAQSCERIASLPGHSGYRSLRLIGAVPEDHHLGSHIPSRERQSRRPGRRARYSIRSTGLLRSTSWEP